MPSCGNRTWNSGQIGRWLASLAAVLGLASAAMGQTLYPIDPDSQTPAAAAKPVELSLLTSDPVKRPMEAGTLERAKDAADNQPAFAVRGQQAGMRIEEPAFVTAKTIATWSWKKDQGTVVLVQFGIKNPQTGQHRYFGYAAGDWKEPPSGDPTVEVFVARELPKQWTTVERPLLADIQKVLGWTSAQVVSFYISPWDGQPGWFRSASIRDVAPVDLTAAARKAELERNSRIGKGQYVPQQLRRLDEPRVAKFETSFEECAPTRNSGANEWSAFGAIGNQDFNCMGRDLWVRYPAFDLVFRLYDGDKEVLPGDLPSFRLGLVRDRMPGIWGGWQHGGLAYKVSVMTVPDARLGNFDLYKLEIQNPTSAPLPSKLVAGIDGPPDLRTESGIVRGLGAAAFVVADPAADCRKWLRDWGLCDKRAKAYRVGGGPGKTEEAIGRYRLGLDGVPVVYRFKAEPGRNYVVYLASTPHIAGHYLAQPKQSGDLVFEYGVEGCEAKRLDWHDWVAAKPQPLCVGFENARDADGDGYIEVRSGVAATSRIRHTRLSAIYVFPEKTKVESLEAVYSGAMNGQCVWHIDVGATPEQDAANQHYDKSDVGFARLKLGYGGTIEPGQTKTFWLRVPSIHRREAVSMGYIAHAFRDVLPGEAVPPCSAEYLQKFQQGDPRAFEEQWAKSWNDFFAHAAPIEVPDRVLTDLYLSRLATRAILDVPLGDQYCYNTCSPFFYFDHAYRDQAYVIYALDLAGMHDRAERLLRVYCRDVKDVPKGPIAFDGKPVQLGMLPSGLWNTRPGQWDTQGENIWALVQHYKLSGDREWLEKTAYPYIHRGATWLVNSRHKHMNEVKDPNDPRYGLLEPGAMEVMEVGKGMHMYYLSGFGILGLREAADAAAALGRVDDARRFAAEALDLKKSLHRSFTQTFKRTGLYEGHLWFGVEPEGVGMYGFWAHNCLLWPCRALDPRDPMLEGTWRRMENMSNLWGGGMHSEGEGGFWPYIGVDRAVSHILRHEPERALDYFCAYTDTAGGTLSWGEGYSNRLAGGDQPHFWADGQWLNLYRQLFAFEDGSSLWLTPALFRRWHEGNQPVSVSRLPTHFGDLDLRIEPRPDGSAVRYTLRVTPKGDQAARKLDRILLYPRLVGGRAIERVTLDGRDFKQFSRDSVILAEPPRGKTLAILVEAAAD
jgi:hypothetical protein